MTDAEISLAVARVIFPEYKWEVFGGVAISDHDGMEFLYADKDCAWDMAVWLGKNIKGTGVGVRHGFVGMLSHKDPQHALAMAILETGQSNE